MGLWFDAVVVMLRHRGSAGVVWGDRLDRMLFSCDFLCRFFSFLQPTFFSLFAPSGGLFSRPPWDPVIISHTHTGVIFTGEARVVRAVIGRGGGGDSVVWKKGKEGEREGGPCSK